MRRMLFVLLALAVTTSTADAVIMKVVSLREAIDGHPHIFIATVDRVDPDRPAVIFTTKAEDSLKGTTPFDRLPINLTGDAEAKKGEHLKVILDRLANGRQAVIYALKLDRRYQAMAFMEGTWFSLQGTIDDDGKTVRWAFQHCEPYLRRTYTGTTAEMKKIIEDHLAKKAEPPKPNLQEKPGFGPIVEKKSGRESIPLPVGQASSLPLRTTSRMHSDESTEAFGTSHAMAGWKPAPRKAPLRTTSQTLFDDSPHAFDSSDAMAGWKPAPRRTILLGVIPSAVLVAPLAVIAALFPGLFARLAVGMKRWRAFLVVASLTSTLAVIYFFTAKYLPETRFVSKTAVSIYLLGITGIGLICSGRRYRRLAGEDESVTATPARTELLALTGLTLLVAALSASVRFYGPWSTAFEPPMREFTFIAIGLAVATAYSCYRVATRTSDRKPDGTDPGLKLSLSGESVALGTLFLCGLITLVLATGGSRAITVASTSSPTFAGIRTIELDAEQVMSSTLTLDGDRLYCGAVKQVTPFQQASQVFAIDLNTGTSVWSFDAGQSLKPPFSGVAAAGGKVYLGEGLHTDSECKLYCLDAKTGQPAWANPVPTTSHTEGTPCIANGKLYFTAGDDGLFCVDAATGARRWQLEGKPRKLHIDGAPAVSGNRVFAGSGLYSAAMLAVNAETGEVLWNVPAPYRSFGAPLVLDDHVIYGLGTGNLTANTVDYSADGCPIVEKEPGGAVVCVEAATGKTIWQYDLTRSVHTPLAGDAFSVYATSRDGCVHCINRKTGTLRWKTAIGGAITAGPALATTDGFPVAVYAVSQEGNVACLNPADGRALWLQQIPGFAWNGNDGDGILTTPVVSQSGNKRTLHVGGMKLSENTGKRTAAIFAFDEIIPE